MYRAAKKGVKSVKCVYGTECFWPPESCGFSHDERESAAYEPDTSEGQRDLEDAIGPAYQEDAKKRAIEVKDLLEKRDWNVELKYLCKRQDCTATFSNLEELFKHQESFSGCPQTSRKSVSRGRENGIGSGGGVESPTKHPRPTMPTYDPRGASLSKQKRMNEGWR